MREELKAQVKQLMTTGLDERELDCFPRPVSVAVVKRLAKAANVPVSEIRVQPQSGRDKPLSLQDPADRLTTLVDWETRPEPAMLRPFTPLVPKRTPAGLEDWRALQRGAAEMSQWFDHNPHGTLAQYSAEQEYNLRHRDHAFWSAMQDMMDRADLAELAGPGGVRGGRGGEWFATSAVTRPTAPTPSRPAVSAPSRPGSMTPWEMVSHPSFVDYLTAKQAGFRGSFDEFLWR